MNFNNPDDVYSSSPLSGDNGESESGDDDNATANLDTAADADDSSQSSARLDAALRQAFAQAGTQKLDLDDDGEMTMELADDGGDLLGQIAGVHCAELPPDSL